MERVSGRRRSTIEMSSRLGTRSFVFRDELVVSTTVKALLDSAHMRAPAPGLATLVPSLADEFARLEVVATSKVPVIIGGESGVGKEVVAAAIHRMSGRNGAFQAINRAAIPMSLVNPSS